MKESKLCIVGPPDSGKTSWFSPFEGKIHSQPTSLLFENILISWLRIVLSFVFFILVFILGIIPSKYIAGVMNDGKFSAHMINEQTQVVMMDEWTPDSLSCEDAKRILQG